MRPSPLPHFVALLTLGALLTAPPAALADLASRRSRVVEVVERVSPAVVHIGTEQIVESQYRGMQDFFDDFRQGSPRREAVQGLGSGVLIDPNGLIVTNEHVIRGASTIHVVLADGRELRAEVLGSDADNDLAVLKVDARQKLPSAKLGTSADLMTGETVIAIGSPFGLDKTVTAGVVSATGRSFKAGNRVYNDFVQTDASINPGNSGGPLLNADGDIVGINTAIFNGAQGIGFAIPADKVRRIVGELTTFGKVRPAWVGVEVAPLTRPLAKRLGWDRNYGAWVTSVDEGSPAARAGIQPGDLVAELSGARVVDAEDFEVRLRGFPAKAPIRFVLFREGASRELTVEPVEFPRQLAEELAWTRLGLRLKAVRNAVVVGQVRAGSAAEQVGLRPGDGLLRLNNMPVPTLDSFRDALVSARGSPSVLLLVQRGRYGYHITLPF